MKAAFYESDITPPLGCYMTGYGIDRRAEDVFDRLYSKAVVIENEGEYAVIISVDICEYPEEMHDLVTKRIFEYTGITPDKVCITSTHTHYGAPVTDNPNINCFGDNPYKDVFYRLVADSAILAYKRLNDASLYFTSIEAPYLANSRCFVLKDGTLKTFVSDASIIEKPFSKPDDEVSIVFAKQGDKYIGAFYSFGCHQDSANQKGYTGDYSSIVAKRLKEKYGPDFVSIYLPGPSGDINHLNPYLEKGKKQNTYIEIGNALSDAIIKSEENLIKLGGDINIKKELVNIKVRKYSTDEFKKLTSKYKDIMYRLSNLIYYQNIEKRDSQPLYIQVMSIGDFALFVYPGELFSFYSHHTKKNSPFKYNMVIENSNSYGGYIPTPDAFCEESDLYEIAPAYDAYVEKDAGDILYDRIIGLANEISKNWSRGVKLWVLILIMIFC